MSTYFRGWLSILHFKWVDVLRTNLNSDPTFLQFFSNPGLISKTTVFLINYFIGISTQIQRNFSPPSANQSSHPKRRLRLHGVVEVPGSADALGRSAGITKTTRFIEIQLGAGISDTPSVLQKPGLGVRGFLKGGGDWTWCFFFFWGGGRFVFFSATKNSRKMKLNEGLERFVGGFVELIHWLSFGLFYFEVDFMWIFWLPSVWFSRECFVFPV